MAEVDKYVYEMPVVHVVAMLRAVALNKPVKSSRTLIEITLPIPIPISTTQEPVEMSLGSTSSPVMFTG